MTPARPATPLALPPTPPLTSTLPVNRAPGLMGEAESRVAAPPPPPDRPLPVPPLPALAIPPLPPIGPPAEILNGAAIVASDKLNSATARDPTTLIVTPDVVLMLLRSNTAICGNDPLCVKTT